MIEIKAVLILGRVSFQKYSKGTGMDLAFYGSFQETTNVVIIVGVQDNKYASHAVKDLPCPNCPEFSE